MSEGNKTDLSMGSRASRAIRRPSQEAALNARPPVTRPDLSRIHPGR